MNSPCIRPEVDMKHETRQKVVCGALPVGICLTVPCQLGACRGLEELVDAGVTRDDEV